MTRTRAWLLYTLAWLPPAMLYAISVDQQRDVSLWQAIISSVQHTGTAAILGVGVWRLCRWLPLGRPYVRFIVVHLLAAVAYSALWLSGQFAWLSFVGGAAIARLVYAQAGIWQFGTGLYVYALIAGVSYLLITQRQLHEREAAAARAQLQTIRNQLNPHFLFNALHAVSALVRTDPAAADRAIERIGVLLRRSLDHSGDELVSLEQEWEFARGYLELEQLRLSNRLRLDCHLDPAALDLKLPALVLQPLVENAVRHGIAPLPNGGTLQIRAERRNGALVLRVADNGPGSAQAPAQAMGFGLESVRGQLHGRYGDRARMDIDTAVGKGFTVTLHIPVA